MQKSCLFKMESKINSLHVHSRSLDDVVNNKAKVTRSLENIMKDTTSCFFLYTLKLFFVIALLQVAFDKFIEKLSS